ncbi:MAG: hypothetical protein ACYCPF_19320 [Streptosporangiaceae bacterium]
MPGSLPPPIPPGHRNPGRPALADRMIEAGLRYTSGPSLRKRDRVALADLLG